MNTTDPIVFGAARGQFSTIAKLEGMPSESWWCGLTREQFYARLHAEEERIRRKVMYGPEAKEH